MAVNAVRIATAVLAAALLLLSLALIVAGRAAGPRLGMVARFGAAALLLAIGLLAQAITPLLGVSSGATLAVSVVGLAAVLVGLLQLFWLWRHNQDNDFPER